MPQTVTVDGEEMLVGDRTTVAAVRKFADVADDAIAFYQEDNTVRLLQDTEIIAEQVPEGTAIEFYPGPIGPRMDLEDADSQNYS